MINSHYDYHKVPPSVRVLHLAWVLFLAGAIVAMVAGYHRTPVDEKAPHQISR